MMNKKFDYILKWLEFFENIAEGKLTQKLLNMKRR